MTTLKTQILAIVKLKLIRWFEYTIFTRYLVFREKVFTTIGITPPPIPVSCRITNMPQDQLQTREDTSFIAFTNLYMNLSKTFWMTKEDPIEYIITGARLEEYSDGHDQILVILQDRFNDDTKTLEISELFDQYFPLENVNFSSVNYSS